MRKIIFDNIHQHKIKKKKKNECSELQKGAILTGNSRPSLEPHQQTVQSSFFQHPDRHEKLVLEQECKQKVIPYIKEDQNM